jgi:sodium transport system permease protein
MSPFRILLKKELLDIARDRRTLVLTLLLPVLLYPGILGLMGLIIAAGKERLKNEQLVVATVGPDAAALLARRPPPPKTTYAAFARAAAETALKEKSVAAIVDVPEGALASLADGKQAVATVLYTKRFDRSMEGLDRMRPILDSLNAAELKGRLEARALDATFVAPVKTEAIDLEFQKDLGPLLASRLLPMLMLMMLGMGGIYAAVDLTAGEKERGTLETLLVSAVTPRQVIAAKYVTVALVAVFSALANLVSMGATFRAGLSLGDANSTVSVHFSLAQLALLLACMVPAALTLAGLALAVASTARTFKEGQTLMTPIIMLVMVPGMGVQMPGVELSVVTSLVPLLNVALLVKATVLGTVQPLPAILTMVTVMLCAVGALWLAASAFQSEVFRFSGTGGWKELFRSLRKAV